MALNPLNIAATLPPFAAINAYFTGVSRTEKLGLTFLDRAGVRKTSTVQLNSSISAFLTLLRLEVFNAAADVVKLSDGVLVAIDLNTHIEDYNADASEAGLTSNCNELGKFKFSVAGKGTSTFSVPSIRDDLIITGRKNKINTEHPDVLALAGEFTGEGASTTTFLLRNMYGRSLVDAWRGKE